MEQRFGVADLKSRKKCAFWMCNKPAKIVIGDIKQPHLPTNFCLCEEHAKQLLDMLEERYPKEREKEIVTVEVQVQPEQPIPDVVEIRTKKRLDSLIRTIYNANGKLTKADLVDVCLNNGVDLGDASSVKITTILEMLFPEFDFSGKEEEQE